jgi:hypothetical protein
LTSADLALQITTYAERFVSVDLRLLWGKKQGRDLIRVPVSQDSFVTVGQALRRNGVDEGQTVRGANPRHVVPPSIRFERRIGPESDHKPTG